MIVNVLFSWFYLAYILGTKIKRADIDVEMSQQEIFINKSCFAVMVSHNLMSKRLPRMKVVHFLLGAHFHYYFWSLGQ